MNEEIKVSPHGGIHLLSTKPSFMGVYWFRRGSSEVG